MLVVLLLSSIDVHGQSDNLLKNASFENWNFWNEWFDDWLLPETPNYVSQSKDYVFEGKYSAKMSSEETGKTAKVRQRIAVTPNSKIRLKHHYYITKWKEKGARMYCYFLQREAQSSAFSSDYLKQFYDDKTLRIIRGGGYGLTYFPHDTNEWLTFDETIIVPPDANYFIFEIHSFNGTTIYVDNCSVEIEEVTSQSTVLTTAFKEEYYTPNGLLLQAPPTNGIYLIKRIYSDNCVTLIKVVR